MNHNDNMLSNNFVILNTELKNKGFAFLDAVFKENGWHRVKNEMNLICYTQTGNETDCFDIKIEATNIRVSVPIKNSIFQYVTTFNNYFEASEYIEARLCDFLKKNEYIYTL